MTEFKVIVKDSQTSCSIKCMIDSFSGNINNISRYASTFGGAVIDKNTITVSSSEALIAMVNKLLLLTVPVKHSKKR